MLVIHDRNVHRVFPIGMMHLKYTGVTKDSRLGQTIELPFPVATVYTSPMERVLFYPERNANPFFHLFESFWMLSGRNDVGFLIQFNKRMKEYSDDGKTLHGAYGHRWRNHFKKDQLKEIVDILRENKNDRRCVLQIWDATKDLNRKGNDVPCNLTATFKIRDDRLDMVVFCRSNDVIWGAYGANVVHFSILQEVIASKIGVPVGNYTQISDSYHAYTGVFETVCNIPVSDGDPYSMGEVAPYPIVENAKAFEEDLAEFMSNPFYLGFRNTFFPNVARPLLNAWFAWKDKRIDTAIQFAETCKASDWRKAAVEWLQRRLK